jgi:hemerythrin-like domain-containing protein
MGKATQDLRKEHDAILQVLSIVDRVLSAEKIEDARLMNFGSDLVYFLRTFADKCHHGKEEDHLFTAMIERGVQNEGGPIGMMLIEHVQGREFVSQMDAALQSKGLAKFRENAANYRELLLNHIDKENNILFMMADNILGDSLQDELFEKFENHEETIIGHGIHEKLHAMIDDWEQTF